MSRWSTKLVIAGLDPAIHLLPQRLCEDGWIRGSSPRMTTLRNRGPCASSLSAPLFKPGVSPDASRSVYVADAVGCGSRFRFAKSPDTHRLHRRDFHQRIAAVFGAAAVH